MGKGLVIRGKHIIQLSADARTASQRHRLVGQEEFMDVRLSFVPTNLTYKEWTSKFAMSHSAVKKALPGNVHLLTLEEWTSGQGENPVLIRLEHQFDISEDPLDYSKPAKVDLRSLFAETPLQ